MARDEFISDRLVNMREHLKRNYEKFHPNSENGTSDAGMTDDGNENADITRKREDRRPVNETPVNLRYMPSVSKKNCDENVLRRFRELEGKVIHHLARSESAMVLLENKAAELKEFHTVLKKSHETLLQMADDGDYSKLESLSAGYYAASGRWQAFETFEASSNVSAAKNAEKSDSFGAWLIAGAIIAGCIILSAVLLILFS